MPHLESESSRTQSGARSKRHGIPFGRRTVAVQSGVAGSFIGTVLVAVANRLPDSNPWKFWLLLLTPVLSVSITGLVSWVTVEIQGLVRQHRLASLSTQLKTDLEHALASSLTSPEHRDQLRGELERLERLLVKSALSKVESLTAENE